MIPNNKVTSRCFKRINSIWWMRLRGFQSYASRLENEKMRLIISHLVTVKLLIWSKNYPFWRKKRNCLISITRVLTTWTRRLNFKDIMGSVEATLKSMTRPLWRRISLSTSRTQLWAHSSPKAYSFARWRNRWISTIARNSMHLQRVRSPARTKSTSWRSALEWTSLTTMLSFLHCQPRSLTNNLIYRTTRT